MSFSQPETKPQGVVAVVVDQAQVLVIRRSAEVVAPGAYCFPGGGIEQGESEEMALVREMQEELGVVIHPRQQLWRSLTEWKVALSWWQVELATQEPLCPNEAEVAEVHWLTPNQMRRLPGLLSSNHGFLQAWEVGEFDLHGLDRSTAPGASSTASPRSG